MAGLLYASGLSLSRCHWMDRTPAGAGREEAVAAAGAIVRPGWAAVNMEASASYSTVKAVRIPKS